MCVTWNRDSGIPLMSIESESVDVKTIASGVLVFGCFGWGEEIEKKGGMALRSESLGDEAVAGAESTAAASVGENDDGASLGRDAKLGLQLEGVAGDAEVERGVEGFAVARGAGVGRSAHLPESWRPVRVRVGV